MNISKISIEPTTKIIKVIKVLKVTGRKLLLVVNKNKKFIGTITDGDIRKVILKKIKTSESIEKFYNKKPKFLEKKNFSYRQAKNIMMKYNIDALPILEFGKVVKVIFWKDVIENIGSLSNLDCIIFAGGEGKRLKPFTMVLPKPLIPFNEKTFLDQIIEKFNFYKISNFNLILNYKSNIIKSYLKDSKSKNNYKFITEKKPLGTIGGLSLINEKKISNNFFVTNCDIILKTDIQKIYHSHLINGYDLTMILIKQKEKLAYGSCKISKNGILKSIEEKPETTHLINSGVYLFKKSILKIIPKNKKLHFNQFVNTALKKNYIVGTYILEEKSWIDIGNWLSYKNSIDKFSF